ncbi:hypothetical protein [Methanobrevibacter sp.]|uniref:hypothetical protein n=1 Tax=Methanobrevibacter sp. TaxID=66852 RepID=UPI0038904705
MKTCPKCMKQLKRVFHDDSDDELAIESINGEVIIGNYCKSYYNYYCEYCDEFFQL